MERNLAGMKAKIEETWRGRIPFFKTLTEVKIVVDDLVYLVTLTDVPKKRRAILRRDGAVLQREGTKGQNYRLLINDVPVAEIDYRYGWNECFALIWRGEVYRIIPIGARKFCEELDAFWVNIGEVIFGKEFGSEHLQEYKDIAAFITYCLWDAWRMT